MPWRCSPGHDRPDRTRRLRRSFRRSRRRCDDRADRSATRRREAGAGRAAPRWNRAASRRSRAIRRGRVGSSGSTGASVRPRQGSGGQAEDMSTEGVVSPVLLRQRTADHRTSELLEHGRRGADTGAEHRSDPSRSTPTHGCKGGGHGSGLSLLAARTDAGAAGGAGSRRGRRTAAVPNPPARCQGPHGSACRSAEGAVRGDVVGRRSGCEPPPDIPLPVAADRRSGNCRPGGPGGLTGGRRNRPSRGRVSCGCVSWRSGIGSTEARHGTPTRDTAARRRRGRRGHRREHRPASRAPRRSAEARPRYLRPFRPVRVVAADVNGAAAPTVGAGHELRVDGVRPARAHHRTAAPARCASRRRRTARRPTDKCGADVPGSSEKPAAPSIQPRRKESPRPPRRRSRA